MQDQFVLPPPSSFLFRSPLVAPRVSPNWKWKKEEEERSVSLHHQVTSPKNSSPPPQKRRRRRIRGVNRCPRLLLLLLFRTHMCSPSRIQPGVKSDEKRRSRTFGRWRSFQLSRHIPRNRFKCVTYSVCVWLAVHASLFPHLETG